MPTDDQTPLAQTPMAPAAPGEPATVTETSSPSTEGSSATPTETNASEEAKPTKAAKNMSGIPADERLLAAIGYIPMLFVAPIIMKPKSVFCQIHGKQALLVTGMTFVVLMVLAIIPSIGSLLFLALIGLIAIAGFQANAGVTWKIPFLYEISSKLNLEQLFAGTTVKPVSTATPSPTETAPTTEAPAPEKKA